MKNTGQAKTAVWKKLVSFLAVLAVFAVICIVSFINIDKNLFNERSTNIQILMGRISLSIEDSMQKQWDYLNCFENLFCDTGMKTLDEAKEKLYDIEAAGSDNIYELLLIDEDGFCYPSEGQSFRWSNPKDLLTDKNTCTIHASEFNSGIYQSYMYFFSPFDTPIMIEGHNITHMAMAVDMDFVDTFFDVDEFGENSASFILKSNGTQIYWQEKDNPLAGIYNPMKSLESAKFYHGADIEQVQSDIANGNKGCVRLDYDGVAYFLAYEPLSQNDWMSVILIEQKKFASGTAGFVGAITLSVLLIAATTMVIIVSIIVVSARIANRRLVSAMEAEQKANAAKTQFLSAMSHDIRTPMNAIVGMTTLAMEHIDDKAYVQDRLKKVKISSQHLLTLINDILDISKVESGRMILSNEEISLNEEAEQLLSIVASQIDEKRQELEVHTDKLLIDCVYADRLRLNQIMMNILSNAIKYTPANGKIKVDFRSEAVENSDRVRFVYVVSDNGIGMSEEFQKDMYSSFARENNEPQRTIQGTGLGLSICKQMVDLMGGTIDCVSEVGKGTTFTVAVELQIASKSRTAEECNEAAGLENGLEGMKILVAEDNDFNWEIASELLAMQGINAERAENGQICIDMLNAAEDGAYDLVLMDIQMPVLNGYQTTELIRASERDYIRKISVIAMTADAFSEDVRKCMEVGMDAHISKPIDVKKLFYIIKKIHGRSRMTDNK